MRHLFDWILLSARNRWLFRLGMLSLICFAMFFFWQALELIPLMQKKQQELKEIVQLESYVADLRIRSTDSLEFLVEQQSMDGDFQGFIDLARWLESARSRALAAQMDVEHSIDSMVVIDPGYPEILKVDLSLKLLPWDGSFERCLSYLQKAVGDTVYSVDLVGLEFFGDTVGVSDSRIHLQTWVRP